MDSLEHRKIMLLSDILKLKVELSKLNMLGTTEARLEMKEAPDLGVHSNQRGQPSHYRIHRGRSKHF